MGGSQASGSKDFKLWMDTINVSHAYDIPLIKFHLLQDKTGLEQSALVLDDSSMDHV